MYKEEVLSWEPTVVLVYDVISDKEASVMMDYAAPKVREKYTVMSIYLNSH